MTINTFELSLSPRLRVFQLTIFMCSCLTSPGLHARPTVERGGGVLSLFTDRVIAPPDVLKGGGVYSDRGYILGGSHIDV